MRSNIAAILTLCSALGTTLLPHVAYGQSTNTTDNAPLPVDFGYVVYPGWEAMDVFGPLEALNLASLSQFRANLFILSATLDPVSSKPSAMNTTGSNFGESIVPTHTFDNPPAKLDVLIVPGGIGTRSTNNTDAAVAFIKRVYPKLQYLITGCTGSAVVAQSGVLDGKRATGNKKSWSFVTSMGPKVQWVAVARWVVDGNIWSSSGITAFLDVTFAWMEHVYGAAVATTIANGIEYERHLDSTSDPFASLYNLTDANNTVTTMRRRRIR